MSELPKGWIESTIADVTLYVQRGKSPKYVEFSDLPVINQKCIRWSGVDETHLKYVDPLQWSAWGEERFLKPGDILWNSTGTGTIGRASIFKTLKTAPKAVADSHVTIVRPNGAVVPEFLYRLIASPSIQSKLDDMQSGSTNQVELSKGEVLTTFVPLAPLAEQRRIVAKIDSLTGKSRRARDHLDHIPSLVEKYKQAILAAAFRGDLTREWRSLASIDDMRWESHQLGDIADIGTGATPKRGRAAYYQDGTIAWVTSGAVNDGVIAHADEYITPEALRETNCKLYPAGTLLMAMYGEGKTRGKVAVLGIEAATNQALAAISVHSHGPAERSFILWYLRSQYFDLREQAAGGVQPNLNLGIVKRICVDLPSPSEQAEIVRRIEIAFGWIDRLFTDANSARKLIDHLDQALLAKAFKGELVPQDPNDEPASTLLDRVRAERPAALKGMRSRKKAA